MAAGSRGDWDYGCIRYPVEESKEPRPDLAVVEKVGQGS
jgi:hypothetical protein